MLKKKLLRCSGKKTESISKMAKGFFNPKDCDSRIHRDSSSSRGLLWNFRMRSTLYEYRRSSSGGRCAGSHLLCYAEKYQGKCFAAENWLLDSSSSTYSSSTVPFTSWHTFDENQLTDSGVCPRLLPLHPRLFSQRQLTRTCGCRPGTRCHAD
jgi:hypothetical protein